MADTKKSRKSSKKNSSRPPVKPTSRVPDYLAIPNDENDWIRYTGKCSIFVGKYKEDDNWVIETEDETRSKLATALEKAGIKCETITFSWDKFNEFVRHCDVICSYNKPYEPYYDDFYLPGLTEFDFMYLERDPSEYHLEFCLFDVL
jgi:hypothetical protein